MSQPVIPCPDCRIEPVHQGAVDPSEFQIVFCKLHAQAGAMREALQANRAVHAHLCTDCIPGSDGVCLTYSALRLKALELTKQALVASEGKET